MKKRLFTFALMLAAMNVSAQIYHFDVNGDKKISVTDVMLVVKKILDPAAFPDGSEPFFCPDGNHPHMIDLDLPSGTKWSCCNVGATSPIEYGGYYAWGETEESIIYNLNYYTHYDARTSTYEDIGKNICATKYDVAYWKTMGKYCLPTSEQLKELFENCTYELTTVSGVKGMLFTGTNETRIFLPLGGYNNYSSVSSLGSMGRYWSGKQTDNIKNAYYLVFSEGLDPFISNEYRYWGHNIRPVENTSSGSGPTNGFGLAMTEISLLKGSEMTIPISNGSGNYTASSSDASVASATIDGESITIKAIGEGEITITVTDPDTGASATITVTVTGPVSFKTCPDGNHPHMIDLGLPSGTLWACCNVDSDPSKQTPNNYGGYYAWGETEEKSVYTWDNYAHYDETNGTYTNIGNICGTQYDVAHVKWGGKWVMPTSGQYDELLDYCSSEWTTTADGINGYLFTSNNGASIFLPASGYNNENGLNSLGEEGNYWDCTKYDYNGFKMTDFHFNDKESFISGPDGYEGLPVRPVYNPSGSSPLLMNKYGLVLNIDDETNVWITSGSGDYTVSSSNTNVATATVDDTNIHVTAVSVGMATITITDNKSGETAQVTVRVKQVDIASLCPDDHHPHMIDLGLPSGTKWACCNVDSDPSKQTPSNYGGYYAWGETEEKSVYNLGNYAHYDATNESYANISNIVGTQYDVAHVKWGDKWMMSTIGQYVELFENCSYGWVTTTNGINGYLFTSNNGASIFLPASGYYIESELKYLGVRGTYWDSLKYKSGDIKRPEVIMFDDADKYETYANGYEGMSVRPVYNPSGLCPLNVGIDYVWIRVGSWTNVSITSGNGDYTVSSNNTNVATATVDGNDINVVAVSAGTANITLTDTKSGQTVTILVNVG